MRLGDNDLRSGINGAQSKAGLGGTTYFDDNTIPNDKYAYVMA